MDLSHGELKEDIRDLINGELKRIEAENTENTDAATKEETISALYQIFVDQVEQMKGSPIVIVIADLAIPKKAHGRVGVYFGGAAEAIIALDTKCIEVVNSQEVEEYEY